MKNIYLSFILILLLIMGCEKIPDTQVNPQNSSFQAVQITAPALFSYSVFDSSFTTSVEFNSVDGLQSVWVDVYSPQGDKVNSDPIYLKDDGAFSNGDAQKGDKIFSSKVILGKNRSSGPYQLKYYALDIFNNTLELGIHDLTFRSTDQNVPPVISDLVAPDSLKLTDQTQVLTLSIKVTDAQGLNDIKNVFLNSFLPPNGTPSTANPILMFDDGNTQSDGDVKAGDGIFSRAIQMPPTTKKGTYRFEFQAIDQFDAVSNTIIHNVVVY